MRKELRFAIAYATNGGNEIAAYREEVDAYLPDRKVRGAAKQLLLDKDVQDKIAEMRAKVEEAAVITGRDVLERWAKLANADVSKIVRVVKHACRHCHGRNHMYQWRTRQEFDAACAKAKKDDKLPPMPAGGFSYDQTRPPHQDCPVCDGEGEPSMWLAATDTLGPAERMLVEGIKMGKHGIEVTVAKPSEYLKLIAQNLGLLNTKPDGSPGGQTEQVVPEVPADPIEASQIYADFLKS